MADLMCSMSDCVYLSKRPLRKWRGKHGEKCYGCSLKYIVISKTFDPDGDIEAVAGLEKMANCSFYKPQSAPEEGDENV